MSKVSDSYVKLFRKIVEWEWFKDSELVHLLLYLVVRANYTDKRWNGITIKRGQLVTTLQDISEKTGISVQTIRTALKKLKSTNELTIESTSKFSLITIVQYDLYQSNEEKLTNDSTNTLTNHQQTINKQLTNHQHILKKEEEGKEYKEINNTLSKGENLKVEKEKKEDTPQPPSLEKFKDFDNPGMMAEAWQLFVDHRNSAQIRDPIYSDSPREITFIMELWRSCTKNDKNQAATEQAVHIIKYSITQGKNLYYQDALADFIKATNKRNEQRQSTGTNNTSGNGANKPYGFGSLQRAV